VADPNGRTTTYCHDNQQWVWEVIDALGHRKSTTYNANANVTTPSAAFS
jgi:uncharacterized protein RhaS with RHS repeats